MNKFKIPYIINLTWGAIWVAASLRWTWKFNRIKDALMSFLQHFHLLNDKVSNSLKWFRSSTATLKQMSRIVESPARFAAKLSSHKHSLAKQATLK